MQQGAGMLVWMLIVFVSCTSSVLAADVTIQDRASVLNKRAIEDKVEGLANPVTIFTMSDFRGNAQDFRRTAEKEIKAKNQIVIALETRMQQIVVVSGKDVDLTQPQLKTAADILEDTYESKRDYTQAVVAALDTFPKKSSFNWVLLLIILLVVGLVGFGIWYFLKQRRQQEAHENVYGSMPTYDPSPEYHAPSAGYNAPYGYNDQYAPGPYGQQPQQSSGINPLVAGGAGVLAGGVIGYALGNQQAQEQQQENEDLIGASVSEDIDDEDMSFGRELGSSDDGGGFSDGDGQF